MADDHFRDSPLSRREFARLAAATGGALALPGTATADASAAAFDAEYQFVLDHTPDDYAVATLVRFSDGSGPAAMDRAVDGKVIATTEPEPAAYARLTAGEATRVADLPTAESLSHSPGSNPFWRLGYYPMGVFPEPRRSTGFVDFEQMVDGFEHLAEEHPDRLRFDAVGQSPGHHNYLSDREDPKGVYVAEVTNDVTDEASFAEKTKVFYSLSIHGLERAGAEAGCRFVEGLLRGTEAGTEALLDDVVLVFGFTNPDGWVAKHPQYDSGWQLLGPDAGAPVVPFYERGTAEVYDTNRHYPVVGWIDPGHYPAEPDGANLADDDPDADGDVPDGIRTNVPDALALVDHLRGYENLEYGTDMHGMLNSEHFVEGLIGQATFDHAGFHELYQMCRVIDEDLEAALDTWTTAGDAKRRAVGDRNVEALGFGTLPEEAFDYAAVWDTIGYSGTGFLGDWLPLPESAGGLGLTSLDFEMAYSHMVGANVYDPELVEMQVTGYRAAIRTLAEYATRAVDASIETGGERTAYVTTDALTRSSADLSFGDTSTASTTKTTALDAADASVTHEVPADRHTLSVHPHVRDVAVSARLRSPASEVVRVFDPDGDRGARCCGNADWTVTDPEPGTWTVAFEDGAAAPEAADASTNSAGSGATEAAVEFTTMAVQGGHPDPREALGYEQRDYEVTPLRFFEEYDDYADGPVDPVSVRDVADGALSAYDHCVVVHDDGVDDPAYRRALASFVENGGNLVVTDAGVRLAGELDADPVAGIAPGDVSRETFYIGHVADRNEDHPLLADTRPIQRVLWKLAPMGYSEANEAPMFLVDPGAFDAAGGTVAGTTGGQVAVGTLEGRGSVHVVGGALPPANQSHLHPFGLLDHAVSFLAHTVVTNALGFEQVRRVDGEVVKRFGPE